MGTKAHPGPFDCHAAAAADEPVFTLRANDPLAPEIVREWSRRYLAQKILTPGGTGNIFQSRVHDKCREAFDCAEDMESWRRIKKAGQ